MRRLHIYAALLIAVLLMIPSICLAADETYEIDGVTYTINGSSIVKVTGGIRGQKLIVPEVIGGQSITRIGKNAFEKSVFGSIVLPDGVTEIANYAFAGAENLTQISLPDSLETMANNVFQKCTSLTSIEIPPLVTRIYSYAFHGCTSLVSVKLPTGLTSLSDYVFQDCSSLRDINLPDGLLEIGTACFRGCEGLKQISVPDSVKDISICAFENCASLVSVRLSSSLTSLGRYTFKGCTSLEKIELHEGIETLGEGVFSYCTSLTSMIIPTKVTMINISAFYHCSSLKSVKLPSAVIEICGSAFAYCEELVDCRIPPKLEYLGNTAFACTGLNSVELPETLIRLGYNVFAECNSLNRVVCHVPDYANYISQSILEFPGLVLVIGQDSPLRQQLFEASIPHRIRETGEEFFVVPYVSLDETIERIISEVIRPGMNDYQKALALHDWLIMNARYDTTYSNYTAEGVLQEGSGVCQSYAAAYALLLDAVDIENAFELGSNHIWNMLKLDGEWYHVDCTWDDPTTYSGKVTSGMERWVFFCVSNYALEGVSNHECNKKPYFAEGYKYNYDYVSGKLDGRLSECKSTIEKNLAAGKLSFSFKPSRFYNGDYGMQNRTAILVMRDTDYMVRGKAANLNIAYDSETKTVSVAVVGLSEPDITLPADLQILDAEAFSGAPFQVVRLPGSLTHIGARAFADCSRLWQIEIPASVTSIAEDAFEGVSDLWIFGESGSAADMYAKAHHFTFIPLD